MKPNNSVPGIRIAFVVAATATMLLTAGLAAAQHEGHDHKREHQDASVADIRVEFGGNGTDFRVTSDKDLSNIIIDYCEPQGDEKIEFEDGIKTYAHTGDGTVDGIWVKSGSHLDPNGPPGAGERFDNPNASCSEEDQDRTLG